MFKLVFFIVSVVVTLSKVRSECCPPQTVHFYVNSEQKRCSDFGKMHSAVSGVVGTGSAGLVSNFQERCEAKVCGDGLHHPGDCGLLACDQSQCNCRAGCFPGDAVEAFEKLHRGVVRNVTAYYSLGDVFAIHQKRLEDPGRCFKFYILKNQKGAWLMMCNPKRDRPACFGLPYELQKKISSFHGMGKMTIYGTRNCTGHATTVEYGDRKMCLKDFDNKGYFFCDTDEMQDNAVSVYF